jgi:hypothetical protein
LRHGGKRIRGKLAKPINVGWRRFQELEAFTAESDKIFVVDYL